MKRLALLTTILTAVLVLVLPFVGGGGPSIANAVSATAAETNDAPVFASSTLSTPAPGADPGLAAMHPSEGALASEQAATDAYLKTDTEHLAQKPVPVPPPATTASGGSATTTAARRAARAATGQGCPTSGSGGGSAPGTSDGQGGTGTTTGDIQLFSATYNAIRIANCLDPVPAGNFRYDACMEQRLYWMADDPSPDPANTWGHIGVHSVAPAADGTYYSDVVPSRGCDGNLAGGTGDTGATVAQKWWDSPEHRITLYKPTYTGSMAHICIFFAMTHGGLGEPSNFTRAAARWSTC